MYSQHPPYYGRERSLSSPSAPPSTTAATATKWTHRRLLRTVAAPSRPTHRLNRRCTQTSDSIRPTFSPRQRLVHQQTYAQNYNQQPPNYPPQPNYGPPQQSSQNFGAPPAPTQQPPAPFLREPTLYGGYGPFLVVDEFYGLNAQWHGTDAVQCRGASIPLQGTEKIRFSESIGPVHCVYMQEAQRKGWREVGRTETINNTPDPTFAKSFQVDFFFEEVQRLRVEVFDRDSSSERLSDHDFLGCVEITMGQLMSSKGQSAVLKLLQNDNGRGRVHNLSGHVVIDAEEVSTCSEMVKVRFTATKLDNKDGWFGASDPFLNIYRLRDEKSDPLAASSWILVWRSEVVMNNCDPKWRHATISVQNLCNGDLSRLLKIECMDWEKNGKHQFIGSCTVKAAEFVTGELRSMNLINRERQARKGKRYKNSGVLILEQIEMFKQHTFAEYLRGGCEVSLIVGIDYTASNGSPSDPSSLHYMGGNYQGQMNDYQAAITATGAILEPYDSDKRFPVYGFGGLVNGVVDHCFPLTYDPSQPEVEGIGGIMKAYSDSFQFVQLHGPTKFAPLVHQAAAIARTFSAPAEQGLGGNLKYFVLLIITDGAIMDMQETIDELVQASMLPLSIVIVAVGNADFTAMNALDADGKLLIDSRRQKAALCPVQPVPTQPRATSKGNIGRDPTQLLQYYNMKGVNPRTPLQRQGTSYLVSSSISSGMADALDVESPNAKRDEVLSGDVVISVPGLESMPENSTNDSSDVPVVNPSPRLDQSIFDMPMASSRTVTNVAQQTIIAGAESSRKGSESLRPNLVALGLVLSYVAVSILVFHYTEDWSIVDCVYYAMVIVTTVGYGDVVPITNAGKAITIFFAFYGICTIGVALGQLASWFLQHGNTKTAKQRGECSSDGHWISSGQGSQDPKNGQEENSLETIPDKLARVGPQDLLRQQQGTLPRLCAHYYLNNGRAHCGAIEGWPILDCFYYTLVTITTVGFGDLSPKSQSARVFAIFYLPLAVVTVAHGIGSILNELSARSVMKTKISMKELLDMDADGDGKVSQLEYLCYMLVKLNKADQDDIDGIIAQFHKLDRDGSGELDRDDLERLDRELQRQNKEESSC
ncbi:EF-Hand 1, calcium-binding site [Phytophthora cactorum]|nr:EF-Hand 1, calcium-binding site [Phytophthora cactorum]